jgi:hypothetical protein
VAARAALNVRIDAAEAERLFASLPREQQLATLHPRYVEIDARRDPSLEPCFWVHREGDAFWYHGFHLAPIADLDRRDVQSPYGYGGPLARSADAGLLDRAWRAYRDWLRKEKAVAEFVRFHPLLGNHGWYGGQTHRDRDTVWMELKESDLFSGYQTRARTAVRKAEKAGLRVEWRAPEEIAGRFGGFYREGMRRIGADDFYLFPDRYFEGLAGWDAVRLAVCLGDDGWLAAALFLAAGSTLEYHLSATTEQGRRLGSTNLLVHAAALRGQQEDCARLYLGGGASAVPDDPLLFFKAGFSKQRAPFFIGRFVYDASGYDALKRRWPERWQAHPDRVLFYRFRSRGGAS